MLSKQTERKAQIMIKMMNVPKPEPLYNEFSLFCADYEVQINGQPCPVYLCRVSAMPFNRIYPGEQRPLNQTEHASFISFSADETVKLQVKCKKPFTNAVIRPLSKQVAVERSGDTVEFTLGNCGQYVLELDDVHFALHIFFNPVRNYSEEEKKAATYYFGPGLHFEQRINLRDNESLYVDEDAVLFASIYAKDAKNVKIFGGGVIDGSTERRILRWELMGAAVGIIRLCNCEHVRVEDVILRDSACFVFNTFGCNDIEVDNIKIVGQWRYNSDGIDPVNTSNMVIKNSFVRSFDDSICVKGAMGRDMAIENITVENCVIWCDWGCSFRIGELFVRETRNLTYRNCDVIHGFTAFNVLNYGQADVHDITFENINIECQKNWKPPVYQHSDDMVYSPQEEYARQWLLLVENNEAILDGYKPFQSGGPDAVNNGYQGNLSVHKNAGPSMAKCWKDATVHDLTFKNINLYLDEGMEIPGISIASPRDTLVHKNFHIDGLYVNGERVEDISSISLRMKNAENVTLR